MKREVKQQITDETTEVLPQEPDQYHPHTTDDSVQYDTQPNTPPLPHHAAAKRAMRKRNKSAQNGTKNPAKDSKSAGRL
jgi:hypothetical protein